MAEPKLDICMPVGADRRPQCRRWARCAVLGLDALDDLVGVAEFGGRSGTEDRGTVLPTPARRRASAWPDSQDQTIGADGQGRQRGLKPASLVVSMGADAANVEDMALLFTARWQGLRPPLCALDVGSCWRVMPRPPWLVGFPGVAGGLRWSQR